MMGLKLIHDSKGGSWKQCEGIKTLKQTCDNNWNFFYGILELMKFTLDMSFDSNFETEGLVDICQCTKSEFEELGLRS